MNPIGIDCQGLYFSIVHFATQLDIPMATADRATRSLYTPSSDIEIDEEMAAAGLTADMVRAGANVICDDYAVAIDEVAENIADEVFLAMAAARSAS